MTAPAVDLRPLAAAVASVMRAVPTVEKDARHPHFGYAYASERALLEALRGPMADAGLVLLPVEADLTVEAAGESLRGRQVLRTDLVQKYLLLHSSGAFVFLQAAGSALDEQDKGAAKAATGLLKTLLRQLFLLPLQDADEAEDVAAVAPPKEVARRGRPGAVNEDPSAPTANPSSGSSSTASTSSQPGSPLPPSAPSSTPSGSTSTSGVSPAELAAAARRRPGTVAEKIASVYAPAPIPAVEGVTLTSGRPELVAKVRALLEGAGLPPDAWNGAVHRASKHLGGWTWDHLADPRHDLDHRHVRVVLGTLARELPTYAVDYQRDRMSLVNPF